MTVMKKIFHISAIAAISLLSASCNNFLEIPSATKFDSSTIFLTEARADMAVLGAYQGGWSDEVWYQLGMGTDEVYSTEGVTNSKYQLGNYVLSAARTGGCFSTFYKGIELSNVCIKGLKGMEQTDNVKKMLGESYALRAANYLNLLRYWGDVPYTTTPVQDHDTFYSSRESRDVIYDGIIADLQEAVKLVPWKSEIANFTPERYCKESVYGLLARVALYAAGYSLRWDMSTYSDASLKIAKRDDAARVKELNKIAMDACKAVMDKGSFKLSPAYDSIFRDLVNGKYNQESMLEQGKFGTNVKSNVGYTNGASCHASSMFGKAFPQMRIQPTLYFDYAEGDTRRDVSICQYAVDASSNLYEMPYGCWYIGKFRPNWKSTIGTGTSARDINFPWMRYAHILLMYAEASNEYNGAPDAEAIAALTQVRERALGKGNAGVIPTSHDEFLKALIKENKLEFAGESWRRTELTRWGILYETLTATKAELVKLAERSGKYADVDRYRVFKPVAGAWLFADNNIPYTALTTKQLTKAEIDAYTAGGYVVVDMQDSKSPCTHADGNEIIAYGEFAAGADGVRMYKGLGNFEKSTRFVNMFGGLTKNHSEVLPLAKTDMDVNLGLDGQQTPGY